MKTLKELHQYAQNDIKTILQTVMAQGEWVMLERNLFMQPSRSFTYFDDETGDCETVLLTVIAMRTINDNIQIMVSNLGKCFPLHDDMVDEFSNDEIDNFDIFELHDDLIDTFSDILDVAKEKQYTFNSLANMSYLLPKAELLMNEEIMSKMQECEEMTDNTVIKIPINEFPF